MYVAVKGGERAIDNAHQWLAEERRGDPAVPELTIPQIREQMKLAVNRVMAEGRIPADIRDGLSARGHLVETMPDFSMAFGGAQGIMVDPDNGTFSGGADPRRDGYAMGW